MIAWRSEVALLPVVIVDLFDHAELVGLVQAALSGDLALVPVADNRARSGPCAFELRVPGVRPVVLLGEPAGGASDGMLPVNLRPFDDAHAGQLLVLACSSPGDVRTEVSDRYAPGRWELLSVVDRIEQESEPLDVMPEVKLLSTVPRVDGLGQALVSEPTPRPDILDPLVGRVLSGKYAVERPLGAGATGTVYRAQHLTLRMPIAVKVMHPHFRADPSFAKRFHAEALAASKLDHPNVLRVLDFGEEPDGLLYIAMELLAGRELRTLLYEGRMTRERGLDIMCQVCSALAAAHDRGVVHRDIKPENVVIASGTDEEGQPTDLVKVCDFGLATIESPRAGRDDGSLAASAVNLVAGTPQYMSPEQIRGENLDGRADLYAVGVMLYELATRRLPFSGESVMDVVQMQLYTNPVRPRAIDPSVDPRLERIVLRALAKQREHRHGSARDLRAELKGLLESRAVARHTERTSIPLDSPESGFQELFISLTTALSPAAGIREDVERERALERLFAACRTTLLGRGEVCFVARVDGADVRVQSGTGEVRELRQLVSSGAAEPYLRRLADTFAAQDVACLALREGVGQNEISELTSALETSFTPREFKQHVRERVGRGITCVFGSELVGRQRALPRAVDLAIARLAVELAGSAGAALVAGDPAAVAAVVGDMTSPLALGELRGLLENLDLLFASVRATPDIARIDMRRVVVRGLPADRLSALATDLLDAGVGPASRGNARDPGLLRELAEALVRRDDTDTYDVLRRLYQASVLTASELPAALSEWADAEDLATTLQLDPLSTLAELQAIPELEQYAIALERVRRAIRVLAARGETPALWATAARLRELASGAEPGEWSHESLAARAAETIREQEVLGAIAETLLAGSGGQRDAGIGILHGAGAAGARALVAARQRATAEQAARPRFVAAMRSVGDVGIPVVAEHLADLAAQGPRSSPALAEDLLRSLPEKLPFKIGGLLAQFMRHEVSGVRRSAITALAVALGPGTRDFALGALADPDPGVRMAALAALRHTGNVDQLAVSRIDRILESEDANDELRAAAAGVLGSARPEARGAAVDALRRALRPQRRSLVAMLKDAAGPGESVLVVTTVARVLIALAGPLGKNDVELRARQSKGDVKKALLALLAGG